MHVAKLDIGNKEHSHLGQYSVLQGIHLSVEECKEVERDIIESDEKCLIRFKGNHPVLVGADPLEFSLKFDKHSARITMELLQGYLDMVEGGE